MFFDHPDGVTGPGEPGRRRGPGGSRADYEDIDLVHGG
jgi:hypothetical protein